jgi:pilus assembly protein CpaB
MMVLASAALVLSVVVTFLTYRMLRQRLTPPEEMTTIVVVAQKTALGARLTQADVRVAPWPKAVQLEGSFHDLADVLGRGVIVPMALNEPVLEAKLAPKEGGAGLTTTIPEGMRAVAIRVNDVIGVSGFVVPGTRVDIILSGSLIGGQIDIAKIILENVQVLAAGQNIEQDANGKPMNVQVITMLVTPEDAEKLALASVEGRMQLALRNPMDIEQLNPAMMHRTALYTGSNTAPAPPPPPVTVAAAPAPPVRKTPPPQVAFVEKAPTPAPVAELPKVLQVQLIQGNQSQVVKFTQLP